MNRVQNKKLFILAILVTLVGLLLSLNASTSALAQAAAGYIDRVRTFDALDMGLNSPVGLAYLPNPNQFFVTEANHTPATEILLMSPYEELLGAVNVSLTIDHPLNITFDSAANRLLLFDGDANELIALTAAGGNYEDAASITLTRYQAGSYGLQDPQGMAIDPATGRLLLLDSTARQVVIITPDAQGGFDGAAAHREGRIARLNLAPTGLTDLRGLAVNPASGHLFLFGGAGLHELSQAGQLLTTFSLSAFNLAEPQALVFAPSGDPTDDPAVLNLYVTDTELGAAPLPGKPGGNTVSGQAKAPQFEIYLPLIFGAGANGNPDEPGILAQPGRVLEFTLTPPPEVSALAAPTVPSSLIKTTQTSQYNPPSPDPSGVAYLSHSNRLLIGDGEVDEMPNLFTGDSLFETALGGGFFTSYRALGYSNEPTGVAYNPANRHLFISDDTGNRGVYQVNPGPDGLYDTADDSVTQTRTEGYGGQDPEGVAFAPALGHLFVVDGLGEEVFQISPGPDGIFNNSGDQLVNQFDVTALGLRDPEGIEYNPDNGHLYILGRDELIAETTLDGAVVRYLDITAANSQKAAGLAYAPASTNPAVKRLYIVDRAVDNNNDPNENDGKLYEMSLPSLTPNNDPPTVNAGPNQTINLPNSAALNGSVTDDGLPNPPGVTTAAWSQISGPGAVTFANPNAAATSAAFSVEGVYVLRLTASDGEVSSSDDVQITVNPDPFANQPPVVSAGADQSITALNSAALDGTVTDDSQPNPPGALITTWSKVSGPGTVTFANANAVDTTATFSSQGTYLLQLTASDGALAGHDEVQIIVTSPDGTLTREVRVIASADDAEENISGSVSVSNSDLELVFDGGGNQTVGLRFRNVTIPPGSSVINAYVQFKVDEISTVATSLRIEGEAADNAAIFTTAAGSISARPRTNAATLWSPAGWSVVGEAGPAQRTANLGVVIEEIVNRPGWVSGNSLALIITGTGERVAEAFNGDAAGAPLLHIEYATSGQQRPAVDAGPDLEVTLPASAALGGSVTDDGLPNPPGAVTTTWSQLSGPGVATFATPNALNTTASFSAAGVYTLRLTASDGQLSATDEVQVTVLNSSGQLVASVRVNASNDDAEEDATGVISLNSSDLELVFDGGGNQTVGLRFNGLDVPPGAIVTNAYVQFKVDETPTPATALTIQGEAADNAAIFTTEIGSISARPRTTAAVGWSPPPWTVVGEAGPNQRTPNVAAVVQEIINRPGWAAGNSLAVIITGSGERVAEAYNGDVAGAPLLTIEYSLGN